MLRTALLVLLCSVHYPVIMNSFAGPYPNSQSRSDVMQRMYPSLGSLLTLEAPPLCFVPFAPP